MDRCRNAGAVAAALVALLTAPIAAAQEEPSPPAKRPDAPASTQPAPPRGPAQPGQPGQPPAYPPPMPYPPGYYYPVPYYYVPPPDPALKWKPGEPAPDGYYVETRADWKTFRSGVGLLVGFWILSVLAGAALNESEEPAAEDGDDVEKGDWSGLYFPVVGPFITMKNTSTEQAGWALLLLDGVAQSAGVILMGVGLANRQQYLERNTAARGQRRWLVAPYVGPSSGGVGVRGSF